MRQEKKPNNNYNFPELIQAWPELAAFVKKNAFGNESIQFSDANAVKALNKAILIKDYGLTFWDIPANYLCPPIPGRAAYLESLNEAFQLPTKQEKTACLDIGTGANCIYPILGAKKWNWNFVATDIDPLALKSAQHILDNNPGLNDKIELRLQPEPKAIFKGVIHANEQFLFSICNPPFHSSKQEAMRGNQRKNRNLSKNNKAKNHLNFGGQSNELWCEGGEEGFVSRMIQESITYKSQVTWFTSLVSKETTVHALIPRIESVGARDLRILPMETGNKVSRILAWSFQL
jgi:23S rRNA (adenine1618-N6)-methyltransferase